MFISQARLDTDAVAQAAEITDIVVKEFQSGTARCYTQGTRIYRTAQIFDGGKY